MQLFLQSEIDNQKEIRRLTKKPTNQQNHDTIQEVLAGPVCCTLFFFIGRRCRRRRRVVLSSLLPLPNLLHCGIQIMCVLLPNRQQSLDGQQEWTTSVRQRGTRRQNNDDGDYNDYDDGKGRWTEKESLSRLFLFREHFYMQF